MVEPANEINGADLLNLQITDTETADHKWKVLQIFHDVRQRLIEHGFKDLAASFPIKEMPRAEETSNFIGMTYFSLCAEVDAETTKGKKLYQTVDRVEVQLLDDNDKFLPIFRLLPTLLHEFAHVLTEVHRAFEDKDMRRKKMKKFCKAHSDHDNVFYNHYRELLKAAEDLGIYVLPPYKPNKFSEQRLRMLDDIDHSTADRYLCGTSKLYQEHDLTHFNTSDLPPQLQEAMKHEPVIPGDEVKRQATLTLSVTNNKGVKKAIVLKERSLACLLLEAGKKLRTKPKKASTAQGTEVTDEFLANLTAFDSDNLVIIVTAVRKTNKNHKPIRFFMKMERNSTASCDYDIRDIECVIPKSKRDVARTTITFGLANKKTNEFVLPKQNLIQYKLLYKTNADCNNYWSELFGDNKPFKEDPLNALFDGIKCDSSYDESSSRVSFRVSIPPGQIATFRILARVFRSDEAKATTSASVLPTELLDNIFSYLSFDERREHASGVCKAWRNVIFGHSVTLPGVTYVTPKETSIRAADDSTNCWCIKINETPSAFPLEYDPNGLFLQWQSSDLMSENPIYTSFIKVPGEVSTTVSRIAATYKLYANSDLLNNRATLVPLDVREKLFQCGVPGAVTFVFCKPIASNSIVISVITVKRRHIQPVEVIPTDKFAKLLTLLHQHWPSIQPHEMKFKVRYSGKRLDISNADQTFAQLGITNFTWLHLDISHPDVIPINVYQMNDKVTTITVKSTMTRKLFRERVHQVTGTDPSKSYIVGLDGNDDKPIGDTHSKERQLLNENICFVYENERATSTFEFSPLGHIWGRTIYFNLDATANTFKKYLVARGECNLANRLKKRGGGVFDMNKSLHENGVREQFDRIELLH